MPIDQMRWRNRHTFGNLQEVARMRISVKEADVKPSRTLEICKCHGFWHQTRFSQNNWGCFQMFLASQKNRCCNVWPINIGWTSLTYHINIPIPINIEILTHSLQISPDGDSSNRDSCSSLENFWNWRLLGWWTWLRPWHFWGLEVTLW